MSKKLIVLVIILGMLSNVFFVSGTTPSQDDNLEISEVTGGLARIRAQISNTGETDISDIEWSISVTGGIGRRINRTQTGVISNLASNSNEYITCSPVFGLGRITVTISVNTVEKTFNGFVFLFFIRVFPELTVDFETVASGLTSPVGLVNAGDGSNRLFIIDQTGIINIIENDVLNPEPFLDISDKIVDLDQIYDERGLLGLAFHPNYKDNGRFFVYYSAPKTGTGIDHESIVAEYQVSNDPNVANPDSETIIFRVDQPEANHNGGQLVFGPDSFLYIGLGDGGGAGDNHGIIGNGQDINTSLGSLLRIDIDNELPYSVPSDNPFVGKDGLDEIYAWGFRNPWRFSFDSQTNDLWVADVGQDEWEEINIVQKGENYGWRIFEGTHPYDPDLADILGIDIETLAYPVNEYSHAVGKSITGGYLYRGEISSQLQGKYVFGDWSSSFFIPSGKLFYLEETQPGLYNRFELKPRQSFNRFILSFGEDEQKELYICTKTTLGPSGNTGDVRRLIVE
ncbi:MAG: PQQ-dependent sugar dehydrogenase [Thermoplasmatota archaeon]